ncbi:MAG: EAL domain-containing protein [Rhodocyclaceae bacterium]|jgi:diguanylate cyclase (GGDEF)-like protein/PAS domain S-box-containing protein|nr:EAL domain-containing protein [Rhodocyclaceae bacterium]MCA3107325.1 EAL domain-containing protein [Rhodocyclaceae bacterium]MCA3120254.1 EAL domain-containing protein [Rhodocyclaceae bacterium]MCA3138692.1 EAL domain-containing protein [Rhodocyclaceae bacterium]
MVNDRPGAGGVRRFAPLLRSLDVNRSLVRRAIAAAAAGEPVPLLAARASILPPVPTAAAVDVAADPAATAAADQTWHGLVAAEVSLHDALDAAAAAGPTPWPHLVEALETSDRLTTLLVDAALAELMLAVSQRERRLTEQLQDEFLDALSIGRFSLRVTDGLIVQADEAFAGFLGTEAKHLIGVPAGRFIPVEKLVEIVEQSVKSGRPGRAQVRTLGVGRERVTLDIIAFMQQAAENDELQCMAVNVSRTDRDIAQRRLLSAAVEASNDLVLITDASFQIEYVNQAFVKVTGYEPDEVLGRHPGFLQGRRTPGTALDRLRATMRAGRPVRAELVNYRKDGTPFWIDLSVVPVTGSDGLVEHWLSVGRDVSERKHAEQEITRLAMEDYLTGLPNRRAAEARLQLEWNRARRMRSPFALGLLDIDHFKRVNDQFGHEVGDRTLRRVAQVVNTTLRGGDWVARWGGEEFLICFHGLDAAGALAAGERMRKHVSASAPPGGTEPAVTVSLGISVYRPALESPAKMLAEADGLLYEAKQAGRDRVLCIGTAEGRRGSVVREPSQVGTALQESRVVAAFQPIIDLRSGEQVGVEALARIIAPDDRVIPASEFLEAAESLRLCADIDEAIAEYMLTARAAGHLTCFINLSPQFLASTRSIDRLIEQAASARIPGAGERSFVIEISERHGVDIASLKAHLKPLVDAGFLLSLDDFGSGYSSFQYLADLPIRFLKIEGWMVARAVGDSRIRQLLETIVVTARKFRLTTVAECVEDAGTASVLRDLGVDWAQGYLYGAPVVDRRSGAARSAGAGAG